jgi:cysteine-rich repeat protein
MHSSHRKNSFFRRIGFALVIALLAVLVIALRPVPRHGVQNPFTSDPPPLLGGSVTLLGSRNDIRIYKLDFTDGERQQLPAESDDKRMFLVTTVGAPPFDTLTWEQAFGSSTLKFFGYKYSSPTMDRERNPHNVGFTQTYDPDSFFASAAELQDPSLIAFEQSHGITFHDNFPLAPRQVYLLVVNNGDAPATLSLRPSLCGNGTIDPGEDCDDGANNGKPGDFCSADCTLPTGPFGGGNRPPSPRPPATPPPPLQPPPPPPPVGNGGVCFADTAPYKVSVSADGRSVAFMAEGDPLSTASMNHRGIFLYDGQGNTLTRVGAGDWPSLTSDGRFLVYSIYYSEYTYGDPVTTYFYDVAAGTTEEIVMPQSTIDELTPEIRENHVTRPYVPTVSQDGRYVLFVQWVNNPIGLGVVVYDRQQHTFAVARSSESVSGAGFTERVPMAENIALYRNPSDGTFWFSEDLWVTGDGSTTVLQPGGNVMLEISRNGGPAVAFGFGALPTVSDDGKTIAYSSLTLGDYGGKGVIYDVQNGLSTTLEHCSTPWLSGNGRYVICSERIPLTPDDTNAYYDVYEYDRITNAFKRVSLREEPTCN